MFVYGIYCFENNLNFELAPRCSTKLYL